MAAVLVVSSLNPEPSLLGRVDRDSTQTFDTSLSGS